MNSSIIEHYVNIVILFTLVIVVTVIIIFQKLKIQNKELLKKVQALEIKVAEIEKEKEQILKNEDLNKEQKPELYPRKNNALRELMKWEG